MMLQTINDLFFKIVDRGAERVMLSKQSGEWNPISSQEIYRSAVGVAVTLSKWGMKKGDRIAILSETDRSGLSLSLPLPSLVLSSFPFTLRRRLSRSPLCCAIPARA